MLRLAGAFRRMSAISTSRIDKLMQSLAVLVVDDNQYMRKIVRNLLVNIGVKKSTRRPTASPASKRSACCARHRDPRLGDAAAQRRRVRAHRALARRVSDAGHSDHHAERAWRALARGRGGADRRQRIPAQAGVRQGVARPAHGDPGQAAPDGAARRLLRPGAAQAAARSGRRTGRSPAPHGTALHCHRRSRSDSAARRDA